MNKLDFAKKATTFLVGAGTAKVATGFIANNTPHIETPGLVGDAKRVYSAIAVGAAGFVIGAMAADATKEYSANKFDEVVSWFTEKTQKTEQ